MSDIAVILRTAAAKLGARDVSLYMVSILGSEAVEASDEILRLRADNEKLRALLKPFADEAQFISPHAEDTWFYYDNIRFGDLRAAATALKETGE